MLKIWGRRNSINVQKAMWAIGELKIPHERSDAGMEHGGVNEPWFRQMNPNGRIPTIDDDGFVLWESNAIVRYLAAKYGAGTLSPADPCAHADADRWMDWTATTLAPVLTPLFWGMVRTPEAQRDPAALARLNIEMQALAGIVDAHLAIRPFMVGETLTMGDIPLGCFFHRWYGLPVDHGGFAHLEAWYARLNERTPYRDNVALPLT
jgi:glutathione S-transferase